MASTITQSYYKNNIPNDVIDRIILCLPAKSLLRFKCVCKYWFSLISNPNFVKIHTIHHSSSIGSVLLSDPFRDRSGVVHRIQYCSSIGGTDNGDHHHASLELVKIDCPFGSKYSYNILGSCNGLVCFSLFSKPSGWRFCVWNPCTEEFKLFRKPPPINCDTYCHSSYGFGYDYSIDDYKLVRNAYKYNHDSFELFSIQVYTLGTNLWKNIIDPVDPYGPYAFGERDPVLFVNGGGERDPVLFANGGGLYWIVRNSQSRQKMIICFDIKTETYRQVSKPWTPSHDVFMNIMNLGVLDGCLCMTVTDENKKYCVDVWMMKTKMNIDTEGGGTGTGRVKEEEEKEYSWIRYFTIRTPVIAVPGLQCLEPLRRFCHEENGDHHVLMMKEQNNKKIIVSYDPKLDKAIYPKWCSDVIRAISNTETTYIESLVSLKSGIYSKHRSRSTVAAADIKRKRKRT